MYVPKISIIMGVYNSENYLREMLDSIVTQTYTDFECILVNDGSTDLSLVILNEYAIKDVRFKVLDQPNLGGNIARENGFNASSGEYVYFIDSDDIVSSNALEAFWKIAASSDADIVIADFAQVENGKLTQFHFDFTGNYVGIDDFLENLNAPLWNKIFRRPLLESATFLNVKMAQDLAIVLQAVCYAKKIVYCRECVYTYRVHDTSISAKYQYDHKQEVVAVLKFINNYYRVNNVSAVHSESFINLELKHLIGQLGWISKMTFMDAVKFRKLIMLYIKDEQLITKTRNIELHKEYSYYSTVLYLFPIYRWLRAQIRTIRQLFRNNAFS